MHRTLFSRLAIMAIVTITGGVFLLGHASAWADSHDSHEVCSNQTLHGKYGTLIQGTLVLPGASLLNGMGLPLRGLSVAEFDGNGNLTQVDHIVVNGVPPRVDWTPGTGFYQVNPDCTGSAEINSPSSPNGPVKLHFVVVNYGREIDQVVDTNAVTAIAKKIE
jgi:hypothetical protein